jgi:hypothetical protein
MRDKKQEIIFGLRTFYQMSMEAMFIGVLLLWLTSIIAAFRMRASAKYSRIGSIAAASPPLVMVALFYSLMIHMRLVLGGWPAFNGERNFSHALLLHSLITENYFSILVMLSGLIWPVIFIVCAAIRRWRPCIYYLGIYAFSFLVCFGCQFLAPSRFLAWWWD